MPVIITGVKEFESRLRQFDLVLQRKALSKAVKMGAAPIRDMAEHLAPRDEGFLSNHIMIQMSGTDTSAKEATARIGPEKQAFYGKFAETGSAFQIEDPWLLPAFERKKREALQIASGELKKAVEAFR